MKYAGQLRIALKGGSWDFFHVVQGTLLMIVGAVTRIGHVTVSALPTVPLASDAVLLVAVMASTMLSQTRMTMTL